MSNLSNSQSYQSLESYIKILESEAIYILREAASQFNKVALLFSGGKDSLVLLHLAKKAFYPARPPLQLIHVDTGLNFPEVLQAIDKAAKDNRIDIIRASLDQKVAEGDIVIGSKDPAARFNKQGQVLTSVIQANSFDAVLGGGRRDEDSARAKERIFSHRDEFGSWDPRNQRPEIWQLYNGRISFGEHMRIFPISNWTEIDIWFYLNREKIELPSIYFSHSRSLVARSGTLLDLETGVIQLKDGELERRLNVRARTVGDIPTSGFIESEADTLEKVLLEVAQSKRSERSTRPSDAGSGKNLEDLKVNGHF